MAQAIKALRTPPVTVDSLALTRGRLHEMIEPQHSAKAESMPEEAPMEVPSRMQESFNDVLPQTEPDEEAVAQYLRNFWANHGEWLHEPVAAGGKTRCFGRWKVPTAAAHVAVTHGTQPSFPNRAELLQMLGRVAHNYTHPGTTADAVYQ